ncbi:MAG: hypothetical protein ACXVDZ_18250 [Bacteroidia bacterium]
MITIIKKGWTFYKRYNLFIGLLLTIIGLWLTISPPSQNPHLSISYQKVDLIKLNETNKDLKVFFRGKDIEKEKLNLKVYIVKLFNDGKSDIQPQQYDSNVPFGLSINNGFITGYNIIESNDNSLPKRLFASIQADSTKLIFKNAMIKAKQYVKFKFTVLHKEQQSPQINPTGSIANVAIQLSENDGKGETDWVAVIKFFVGLIIAFIVLVWIINNTSTAVDFIFSFIRKIIIKKKFDQHYDPTNRIHRIMVKIYSITGKKKFIEMLNILEDSNKTNELYNEEIKNKDAVARFYILYENKKVTSGNITIKDEYESDFLDIIEILKGADPPLAEQQENGTIKINPEFINAIRPMLKLV